ncbi:MAG: hypothetical protein Q8O30_10865 [Candidatus Omnitrophota bacterium]|nr:hypothetical protein [Candidatus Omnitrophota bacterium]
MKKSKALDFLHLAEEYFKALQFLDQVYKDKVPDISQINTMNDFKKIQNHPGYPLLFDMINVKLFLARHSLELVLKSFLLHKGVSISDLKNRKLYHHNIEKCYHSAKKMGLNIFKNLEGVRATAFIGELNKYWLDKIYEYPNKIIKGYSKYYLKIINDIFVYVRKDMLLNGS